MSRSKEGREQITPRTTPTDSKSTSETLDDRLGSMGQTDYTPGRESYRDFPRRSTSARNIDASSYQPRGEFDNKDRYDRGEYNSRLQSESNYRYGQAERSGRRSYGELSGRMNRYRGQESDYDRSRSYRDNRPSYDDRYNRQYERDYEYDRDDMPTVGSAGFGAGRGIDTEQWRRERGHRERNERQTLRCGDIMTKDVTTCAPQQSIREAAEKMEDENVGSIPVLENGRLLGIVTDRDIVCRILAEGKDTRTTPVAEAMSQDIVTCTTDDTIQDAIRKMAENQIRRLPVVDFNGRLRGIVAMADIALEAERDRDLACALEEISRPTPNQSRRV